ncbi:MAG: copper chaperone PCu(A)C [Caldilineaceae bacterium]
MKRDFLLTVVGLVSLFLGACMQAEPAATGLQIVEPWARAAQLIAAETVAATESMTATMMVSPTHAMTGTMGMGVGGVNSAVYMTIRNPGNQADRLIKAESDAATVVELHNVANNNGVMSMFPVEEVAVPAQGEAVLKPGSYHVMLIGLTRDLTVGDTVTVTLTFEQAGATTVAAEVRER